MEVLYYLIPLAILFAGLMLLIFVRATQSGQFDDLETPAVRILLPEEFADRPMSVKDAQLDEQPK